MENFSKLEQNPFLTFKLTEEIITELNAIFKETEKKDFISPYLIANRMLNIICTFLRSEPTIPNDSLTSEPKSTDVRIASAKQYIDDNKNLFLTCDDVAQYCHFNTKYLNRIFKLQTGKTLLEYIHEVKISEAERLLTETVLTLDEIAIALGFSNEYYFNTFFKRMTGKTPLQYRKAWRNRRKIKNITAV